MRDFFVLFRYDDKDHHNEALNASTTGLVVGIKSLLLSVVWSRYQCHEPHLRSFYLVRDTVKDAPIECVWKNHTVTRSFLLYYYYHHHS